MMVSSQATTLFMGSRSSDDRFSGKIKLVYLRADGECDESPPSTSRSKKKQPRLDSTRQRSHLGAADGLSASLRQMSLNREKSDSTWAQRTGLNPSHLGSPQKPSAKRSGVNKSRSVNDLMSGSNTRMNTMDLSPSEGQLTKWSHRSTSNRLLNCFTIDDCAAKHRERLAVGKQPIQQLTPPNSRKARSLEHFNSEHAPKGRDYLFEEAAESRMDPPQHSPPSMGSAKRQSDRMRDSSRLSLYMTERMSFPGSQDTVERAMYTLLGSTEVVNNTTHVGLFKRGPAGRTRPELVHQESKRFRRMNDTLRKWIDEEYIRPRTCPSNLEKYRSTPTLKAKVQIRPKSGLEERSHSVDLHKGDKWREEGADVLTVPVNNGIPTQESMSNGKRSDSLLQMLMGMEQDGVKMSSDTWRSVSATSSAAPGGENGTVVKEGVDK